MEKPPRDNIRHRPLRRRFDQREVVALNDVWARPLGDFNHRWLTAIFRHTGPIKDLLHGRWLGHPLHAALTDVPIGLLLGVVVLDLVDQPTAADVTLLATILFIVLSAFSGLADYSDTDGTARTRATTHATVMTVALLVLVASVVIRAGAGADRTVPIGLDVFAFLLISAGAFVGGEVVYVLGNMVSRHAFRGPGTKWIRLETGEVADLAQLPEATPTKMKAGINDLVLVRLGDRVHALHAVCAHAGGPLDKGRIVADCIECPWHASRFRLTDGLARRGPTVYDQPAYEIRAAEGGGYEVCRKTDPPPPPPPG